MRPRQAWKCEHTDRPYRALGLCRACYLKQNGGSKRWYLSHRNEAIQKAATWVTKNQKRRREIARNWSRRDYIVHRITWVLRARLGIALRGYHKAASTMTLVGCSIPQLKTHLESQFLLGMSWENHSRKGWHIDHKQPCASFDLRDSRQQRACFHYTNLQPLWAFDNLSKGKRT